MTGVLIVVAYAVLIWQVGWWGLLAVAVHVGIQLGAARLLGGIRRKP